MKTMFAIEIDVGHGKRALWVGTGSAWTPLAKYAFHRKSREKAEQCAAAACLSGLSPKVVGVTYAG